MSKHVLVVIVFLSLSVSSTFAQSGGSSWVEPHRSYLLCNWGMLTIEYPARNNEPFITLTSPENKSGIMGRSFTVTGEAGALFDDVVEVAVYTNDSNDFRNLFSGKAPIQTSNKGGAGLWTIDVDLGVLEAATSVRIYADSTSPDGELGEIFTFIDLNMNSPVGLPSVSIAHPLSEEGVSGSPLHVDGHASVARDNTIGIIVRDWASYDVLAETTATVQTDESGGAGSFFANIPLNIEPGTLVYIIAYHLPINETGEVTLYDTRLAVIDPLGRFYDRIMSVQYGDHLSQSDGKCPESEAEFDNTNIQPLIINDVQVEASPSALPLVNVTIDAAGTSGCTFFPRVRSTRQGHVYAIEVYRDAKAVEQCKEEIVPLRLNVSLGTLESPTYEITVNGQPVR